MKDLLREADGVVADEVVMDADTARRRGLAGATTVFPLGNLAPGGSVVKATAIDPSVVEDEVYRHRGTARVFTSEAAAIAAIKGLAEPAVRPDDVLVLAGLGPARHRHGGDLPGDLRSQVPALGEVGRGDHRRPLLRRLDGRLRRPRQPRGAGRAGRSAACATATSSRSRSTAGATRGASTSWARAKGRSARRRPSACSRRVLLTPASPRAPTCRPTPASGRSLQEASGGIWAGAVYDPDRIARALAPASDGKRSQEGGREG